MDLVDASVFVSYLVRDDIEMADRALAYFERVATGDARATALEASIAEVVYVLGSKRGYRQPRAKVVEGTRSVIAFKGSKCHLQRR